MGNMGFIYMRGGIKNSKSELSERVVTTSEHICTDENTQNSSLFKMRNYKDYEMRTNASLFEMTSTT